MFRFVVEAARGMVPDVEKPDYEAFRDDGETNVLPSEGELQTPTLSGMPSWHGLQQRWNRRCSDPKWRYEDMRNFRRAFLNAARVKLRPTHGDPRLPLAGKLVTLNVQAVGVAGVLL